MNQKGFINIILIIIVIALFGAGVYFVSTRQVIPQIPSPVPTPIPSPTPALTPKPSPKIPATGSITVDGETACLPKKGARQQTLECAIGLKAADGRYYGLKNLFKLDPEYKFSIGRLRVEVSGTFNSEEIKGPDGNKYDAVGIIDVNSIRQISLPVPRPTPHPTPKPILIAECKTDSDCPTNYACQAIQGTGTACPSNDPNCKPTFTITKGICKVKVGGKCSSDEQCQSGLPCHADVCINPIGRQCNGSSDTSCPSGYQCIQSCGLPVAREGGPPSLYYCELNEYAAKPRMCPVCLAGNTLIDTPSGSVPVKSLQVGMSIWTTDKTGQRILGTITKTSKVPVLPTHQMVHLVFNDGRELFVSPGHPTIDGRTVGDLVINYFYDGARVVVADRVIYGDTATYDILPSGKTGFYWANGILLNSTLH